MIFNKEEKAVQVINEIESILKELQEKAKGKRPVRVLTVEFMGDKIEVLEINCFQEILLNVLAASI